MKQTFSGQPRTRLALSRYLMKDTQFATTTTPMGQEGDGTKWLAGFSPGGADLRANTAEARRRAIEAMGRDPISIWPRAMRGRHISVEILRFGLRRSEGQS